MMSPEEEQCLIEECRHKPSAFAAVFDEWYSPVFGYVYRRTVDYDLSRDITAETFLKAFLHIGKFKWRGIRLSAWIYRIASNELNIYYRSRKYRPESLQQLLDHPANEALFLTTDDEREMLEREIRADLDFMRIRSNLQTLDLKYQEVIALRFFEQKPIKEIAAILGKNEGTVKSLISRGLQKLRVMH